VGRPRVLSQRLMRLWRKIPLGPFIYL